MELRVDIQILVLFPLLQSQSCFHAFLFEIARFLVLVYFILSLILVTTHLNDFVFSLQLMPLGS